MIVVACIPAELDPLSRAMLTGMQIIATAADHVYRVGRSTEPVNVEHIDLVNGSLLISIQSFSTLDEAKAWIARDGRQRLLLKNAPTGAAS